MNCSSGSRELVSSETASEKVNGRASEKVNKRASEKAKKTTSEEVNVDSDSAYEHDSGPEEATDPAAEKTAVNNDAISLFGCDSPTSNEPENEVNNDDLFTEIITPLTCSEEVGPPVSDKLSKVVNDKF